ncbi:MAG: exodeoxyribonuclease V subunit beta [Candidatus Igneacidithiobacillus chanchocoensis]
MREPPILDPLHFPLTAGRRLIEASAGTGKTYTIAALYLRLVLGHGCARPYLPEELLVMTFTNAATMELRARVRQRLYEAGEFFAGRVESTDAFLQALRGEYPESAWPQLAQRLEWAAEGMDQAAIYTIHAWVQLVLQEYAFAANSDFSFELVQDAHSRTAELIQDYFRLYLQPLAPEQLCELQSWNTELLAPDGIAQEIKAYLDHAEELRAGPVPGELINALLAEQRAAVRQLRAKIVPQIDTFAEWLDQLCARQLVDGRKLHQRHYRPWLQTLRDWCADTGFAGPKWSKSAWERLNRSGLEDARKQSDVSLEHPFLGLLEELSNWLEKLAEARYRAHGALLSHALAWIAERKRQLQERGELNFSGLLRRLQSTLTAEGGAVLARQLARRYPWALVDEFQDTDPQQYAILDTIYRPENGDTGLLLIGDPKQAIYAFRGADLPTYLLARQACADDIYRLACNYRSSAALLDALNALFTRLDREAKDGLFGLRQGEDDPMPYLPVGAAGREERPTLAGTALPAVEIAYLVADLPWNKTDFTAAIAEACAERIVKLLLAARSKEAGFVCDGNLRPLRAADMAVLVNDFGEAKAIRAALGRRGVASVYLSERESVYATAEAEDLEALLAACLAPSDEARLQAALAAPLLQLTYAELAAWRQDAALQERLLAQFYGYGKLWQERGVLAMLFRLLQDFSVPAKLLQSPGGERRLTNLLQIAELLQAASRQLAGEHALLRFLAEQRKDGAGGDEALLRLESDANLLRVVTIHGAKGLQYPLVFLPFLLNARSASKAAFQIDNGTLLPLDAQGQAQREAERRQEDARKLYVALTRAEFYLWLGMGAQNDAANSVFGQLVFADAEPLALRSRLAALLADLPETEFYDVALDEAPARLPPESSAKQPQELPEARAVEADWWIASYTALHQQGVWERLAEDDHASAVPEVVAQLIFAPGAQTGILLHDCLRCMAQYGFARHAADAAPLRQEIHQRGVGEQREEPLFVWLLQILAHPLALPNGDVCRLQDLQEYSAEMEFWLPLDRIDSRNLDAIVRRHLWPEAARPSLANRRLGGIFKGFIDLAFCWQGTYYLLDYKSNFLGLDAGAYAPTQLQAAALAQRYDLQLALYLFALRRLLQKRLPTASVGAALALFLRGITAGAAASLALAPAASFFDALEPYFSGEAGQ